MFIISPTYHKITTNFDGRINFSSDFLQKKKKRRFRRSSRILSYESTDIVTRLPSMAASAMRIVCHRQPPFFPFYVRRRRLRSMCLHRCDCHSPAESRRRSHAQKITVKNLYFEFLYNLAFITPTTLCRNVPRQIFLPKGKGTCINVHTTLIPDSVNDMTLSPSISFWYNINMSRHSWRIPYALNCNLLCG